MWTFLKNVLCFIFQFKRAAISIEYLSNYLETRAILRSEADPKELSTSISTFQQDFVNVIFIFSWFQICQPCYTGQINETGFRTPFLESLQQYSGDLYSPKKRTAQTSLGATVCYIHSHRHRHSLCFIF